MNLYDECFKCMKRDITIDIKYMEIVINCLSCKSRFVYRRVMGVPNIDKLR